MTAITKGEPVPFSRGQPDFSRWAQARFQVRAMDGSSADFQKIWTELARVKGFRNAAEAQRWASQMNLTPHHAADGIHIEMVPTNLNKYVAHVGGASGLRAGVLP